MTTEQFSKFDVPGADDLAVMFEFYQKCNPVRDVELTRKLNPEIQDFETWVQENKDQLIAAIDNQ